MKASSMKPPAEPAHGEPLSLWPVRGRRPPGDPRYHRQGESGIRAALDGALCRSFPPAGEPPGTGACPRRLAGAVAPVLGRWVLSCRLPRGETDRDSLTMIREERALLRAGKILAVKGLGGFL